MEAGNISYNMPAALLLPADIDFARLEATFKKLIQRHESLRTSFEIIAGEPVQKIHPTVEFGLEFYGRKAGSPRRPFLPLKEENIKKAEELFRSIESIHL